VTDARRPHEKNPQRETRIQRRSVADRRYGRTDKRLVKSALSDRLRGIVGAGLVTIFLSDPRFSRSRISLRAGGGVSHGVGRGEHCLIKNVASEPAESATPVPGRGRVIDFKQSCLTRRAASQRETQAYSPPTMATYGRNDFRCLSCDSVSTSLCDMSTIIV